MTTTNKRILIKVEEVYNGLDDDCNPATLDDDLDQDGFLRPMIVMIPIPLSIPAQTKFRTMA